LVFRTVGGYTGAGSSLMTNFVLTVLNLRILLPQHQSVSRSVSTKKAQTAARPLKRFATNTHARTHTQ
jgi:hypothetical protein